MRKYKLISHIADIRLKVEADSLPELFVAALEGMNSIIKTSKHQKSNNQEVGIKRSIEIQALDATALLVDFLNEILYQSHVNKEIYREIKFLEFPSFAEASAGKSEIKLRAEICGQKVEEFDEDIKAVTYHEADIIQNEKGNFETMIVFDI